MGELGRGGGEAIQALQDDQHPRLVHLVRRGMGEVGRRAGRLFRLFKMTSIPDCDLKGWERGAGEGLVISSSSSE